MDCVDEIRRRVSSGERHTALAGLFLRTFDSMSYCIRSAVSGNYTGSGMYARDLLETQFLIEFLLAEPGRPEHWLNADSKALKTQYSPLSIRMELDKRNGFTKEKRRQAYAALSSLAAQGTIASADRRRAMATPLVRDPWRRGSRSRPMAKASDMRSSKAASTDVPGARSPRDRRANVGDPRRRGHRQPYRRRCCPICPAGPQRIRRSAASRQTVRMIPGNAIECGAHVVIPPCRNTKP